MYLPEILGCEFSTLSGPSLTLVPAPMTNTWLQKLLILLEEERTVASWATLSFSNTKYRLVTCSSVVVTYQIHNVTNQIEGLFIYLKPILFFFII